MDALATLHMAAQPLLARVDSTLSSHGMPAGHPVVALLRRWGQLPSDAVANVVAWAPEPLRERARLLRVHAERCAAIDGVLRPPSTWEGEAAAAFAARLDVARAEHDGLVANAANLASYLDELADWIDRGRARLAHALAAVMTSAECVTLTMTTMAESGALVAGGGGPAAVGGGGALAAVAGGGGGAAADWGSALVAGGGRGAAAGWGNALAAVPGGGALAAADIAAEVLAGADTFWEGALDITDAWSARLGSAAHAPPLDPPRPVPTLRVDL